MKNWDEWKPFVAMIAVDFGFAVVNILLKKVVEEGMNHLVFITYRLCISSVFLAPIGYFWERNGRRRPTFRVLCYLFFSAIVGASVTQYLYLLGIQNTSATFASAFVNMVPVFTFILALPFGIESVNIKCKSGRAKILGTGVCIGGALLLSLYKGKPLFHYSHSMDSAEKVASPPERWTIGVIALTLGTLLWSSWFILQSHVAKSYPFQYSTTAIMTFFAAIQSALLTFSTRTTLSSWVLKGHTQILTLLFSGMVGSGLCFVGMSWCVKKKGPVFTAAFSPLVQIMAAMIDIPILHGQLHLGSLMGSILVMMGLYILLWGKNKELQKGESVSKPLQQDEEMKEPDPEPPLQHITVSCDPRCPT